MRKVVIFKRAKKWWHDSPDVDLLNVQIEEIERDGWNVISVTSNANLFGVITSFTILIESASN